MSEIPMYPDELPADEDRCFCGAKWNDVAEECLDGHSFGEADKFRVRAEKAEAIVQTIRVILENYGNDEHLRADQALGAIDELVNP